MLMEKLVEAWGNSEQQAELVGIAYKLLDGQLSKEEAAEEIMGVAAEIANGVQCLLSQAEEV